VLPSAPAGSGGSTRYGAGPMVLLAGMGRLQQEPEQGPGPGPDPGPS
jgi:hypothetical protein